MISALYAGLQAAAALFVIAKGHSAEPLFLDSNAVSEAPIWTGMISQLGGMLMTAAAAVAIFAAFVLAAAPWTHRHRLLLEGGALSAAMAVDDMLMLHDGWLGRLGVPESFVEVLYALTATLIFVRAAKVLRTLARPLQLALGMALTALCASVLADLAQDHLAGAPYELVYLEEGAKQLGFLLWTLFFSLLARSALIERPNRAPI